MSLAQSAEPILALLADCFECPIFVHNASGLLRDERAIHRFVKQRLTKRIRGDVIRLCNRLLTGAIDRVNAGSVKHVHLLDEKRIVDRAGEFSAGAYFHKTDMQHPAAIGRLLAPTYVDLIYVYARLVGRKLVVCDLDNTLWKGVIGEGPVDHFLDRQRILKRLKERGVVLAILSKNDPANVSWQGGILAAEDFVYSAVSWDQKVKGMQRIETSLNLKNKDFVFIDDRAHAGPLGLVAITSAAKDHDQSRGIQLAAGLDFASNIDLRRWHFAHQNYCQTGGDPLRSKRLNLDGHLGFNFISNCDAI